MPTARTRRSGEVSGRSASAQTRAGSAGSPRQRSLLDLQRSAGNRAVAGLLRPKVPSTPTGKSPQPRQPRQPSQPRQPAQSGQPLVIQRFEAQHHEQVERAALTAPVATGTRAGSPGFTDAEATATYFGNWSRDMSQALSGNPVVGLLGPELVFEIVNAMAVQKFGRMLDPADFGVYSPREHLDNPAGQVNADLLRRDLNTRIHGTQVGTEEDIGGHGADGGGSQAERTERLRQRVNEQFAVNAAGLPAYLGSSIQYVERELSTAADLGRENPDALMRLGNGLHTVEDLFAHSNFVEIAAGKLFRAGRLPLPAQVRAQLEGRRCEDPSHRDHGHPLDAIDVFGGQAATGRPILITGTFVAADTKLSIAEAMAAFLSGLRPFGGGGNRDRMQQVVRLLLGRYESLAGTGKAGELISTALGDLGSELTGKLADAAGQAIAGESPAEGAGLWSRALSGVRGAAGAFAGAGLRMAGSALSWDWVQQSISVGVNAYGSLPLVSVYDFVTGQSNAIDDFMRGIDRQLRAFPFYLNAVKPWLDHRLDSLRESLKGVIESALAFMAQLLQAGFVEQQVSNTNIARQIQSQITSEVRNPAARAELLAAAPEERISMLMNPAWCAAARVDVVAAERIASMQLAPEYVQAAASHSQLAKDHADSPFFGTAAALAASADTRLRDLVIAVWSAEGRDRTNPDLAANYGDEAARVDPYYAARRPPPGKPESQWTRDERIAERHARQDQPHYGELKRRQEGEELRRTGAFPEAEEDHGGAAVSHALSGESGHLMGAEQRRALHELAPVATSEWTQEYAASGARARPGTTEMSPERAALFEFVRTIFGHPYDTDWYEPALLEWCENNQERLAAYIASRNRGELHHHPH